MMLSAKYQRIKDITEIGTPVQSPKSKPFN